MVIRRERRNRWIVSTSLVCYLAVGAVPYLVSGLVVPPGAVVVLMVCWGIGLIATVYVARRRPLLAPAAVVAALMFWFGFVTAGSALFGWSA